jgi:ribonuclease HI
MKTIQMKTVKRVVPLLAILFAASVMFAATTPQRYLHVRVHGIKSNELVSVNVPLSLAEMVIPAINHGKLRNGKIQVHGFNSEDVNLKQILEALKAAPEGEFVTVQETDSHVRVAKEHGQLVVHVADKNKKGNENVDVTIPWAVAQALASDTGNDELNVEAAIKALENAGDVTLVAVNGDDETVRIWIDSNSGSSSASD